MATTPNRKTVVTINTPVTIPQQGNWWNDLVMQQISSGVLSTNAGGSMPTTPPNGNYNTQYVSNIGWRLTQYQQTLNYRHETTLTDTADVDPAGWATTNANTGIFQAYSQRFPSELNGIGSPAGPPYNQGPGDNYYMKYAAAEDSVAVLNSADQAAFHSPNAPGVPSPFIMMDRIYTGTSNHYPNEDVWFYFWVPHSTPFKAAQIILHEMFTGIPTYITADGTNPGKGQYALTLYADGTGILQEAVGSTPNVWVIRTRFNWCNPHDVAGQMHAVHITSDAHLDSNNQWVGTLIQFSFDNTNATNYIQEAAQFAVALLSPSFPVTYNVIQISPVQPTPQPIRLDVRRDIFLAARIQKSVYFAQGFLKVKLQDAPLEPKDPTGVPANCPLKVEIWCNTPVDGSGSSSIDCHVYENSSGTALPQTQPYATTTESLVFYFKCPLNDSTTERFFNCIITLNSTPSQAQSPVITRVTFVRDPISKTSTPTPVVCPNVTSISFSGPDRDMSHETLAFTSADTLGVLDPILTKQGGQTVCVDIYNTTTTPATLASRVFQGRLMVANRRQIGNSDDGLTGYANWGLYDCRGVGEFSSLAKLKTYRVYQFAANQKTAHKVTAALNAILSDFYLPIQLDIPDLPQQFFAQGDSDGTQNIESYTPLLALISDWARYYLGAYWVWDANYTNGGTSTDLNGCLRLIVPPSPSATPNHGNPGYNYACQFLTDRPDSSFGIPSDNPYAWPTLVGYNPNGSNMVQTFCRKFSFTSNVIPPDANIVAVTGIGVASSQGTKGNTLGSWSGNSKLVQVLHNWPAADFGQNHTSDGHPLPDPSHPDFTDGIPNLFYHCDPSLRTQSAVNFMARRIFDLCCHTQYFEMLEAPFVWIYPQSGDMKWIRPRGLRFGDPVLFNGQPMFVWSAPSGKWEAGRDENQQAYYELRSIPALTARFTASGTDQQYLGICAEVS